MKRIRSQIIIVILTIIVLLISIFGVIGCYLNYSTADAVLKLCLMKTADVSSERVSAEIKGIQNIVMEAGSTAALANSEIPKEAKKQIIEQKIERYGYESGNVINSDGISIFDGINHSDKDYFQVAMKGENFISDPVVGDSTEDIKFFVSTPLWKDGIPGTQIVGVVYFCPKGDFLNKIVKNIDIGKTGYAYIINNTGTNVADSSPEVVGVENSIEDAKTDDKLEDLAVMEKKMLAGEHGFGTYTYEGAKWVQGYAPINNSDNWSIGVASEMKDCLKNYYISIKITIILGVIFILLGTILASIFANRLSKPITECSDRILKLSKGDLTTQVVVTDRKDETGVLSKSTKVLVDKLNDVVEDITYTLGEMAKGNFRIQSQATYEGNFIPIHTATEQIIASLNTALNQINESADQVSISSDQVSITAQTLSQGTIEQAGSIEELSASINEISTHVKENANTTMKATDISNIATENLIRGNQEMGQMIEAMGQITHTSREIERIIKTIDDIAFQTNILALNAAVEAARAGEAGKGFAVVADEVRNLALKSAEAAKGTADLIEGSIKAVNKGSHIADSTAKTIHEMVTAVEELTQLVSKIAETSIDQANAIEQVTQGIEQISMVVQNNSASAEESAASSEELSGQAHMLKSLVGNFSLKDSFSNAIPSFMVETIEDDGYISSIHNDDSLEEKY